MAAKSKRNPAPPEEHDPIDWELSGMDLDEQVRAMARADWLAGDKLNPFSENSDAGRTWRAEYARGAQQRLF